MKLYAFAIRKSDLSDDIRQVEMSVFALNMFTESVHNKLYDIGYELFLLASYCTWDDAIRPLTSSALYKALLDQGMEDETALNTARAIASHSGEINRKIKHVENDLKLKLDTIEEIVCYKYLESVVE